MNKILTKEGLARELERNPRTALQCQARGCDGCIICDPKNNPCDHWFWSSMEGDKSKSCCICNHTKD